jgi:hypothetical protein
MSPELKRFKVTDTTQVFYGDRLYESGDVIEANPSGTLSYYEGMGWIEEVKRGRPSKADKGGEAA